MSILNTIKFSQFVVSAQGDSSTELVGLATGQNIRTPKTTVWTTATRPGTITNPTPPYDGLLGFNTDLEQYEFWSASLAAWVQLASTVNLLGTFILKTPDPTLPNSFALSTLSTGILKSTTGTGQPSISAPLTSIDSLVTVADEIIYTTAPNVYAVTSLSTFSRGLLADTTALQWRTDLGVAGLPVNVAEGGTGKISFTPFSVIAGGTTSTNPLQSVATVGVLGQVLTSNGPGALPTWQNSASSGIVNPGLQNQVAYYAANGSAVSGLATASNAVLVTDNSGVPSISTTLPLAVQSNITQVGTITSGTWNGSVIGLAFGGTNANLVASAGSVVYSTVSAMAFSAVGTTGQLLQSNGAGAPSWTTAAFPGTVGSVGTILRSNGTDWVASTATFADTYSASNILYSNGANTVVGLATANNGVLITSGGGVPSISSTLPSAVQLNITQLGIVTAGTWNATPVTVPFGGTGDTSFTAFSVICGGTTSTGNLQNVSGVGAIGQVLTSNGPGALPSWVNAPGTGTINSGLINQLAYYAAPGTTLSGLATANDGLLVTSNTGAPSILAGPGTAGNVLQSNASSAPSFSTATYPSIAGTAGTILRSNGTNWVNSTSTFADTYTASNLLYSNGSNAVTGLATANNGLLVTSSSGIPSILGGPGTTGNILQSNAAAAPSFSTATYPSTTTINQLLYSSANNVVSGLSTANNGILVTSAGGVPSISSTLPQAVVNNITAPTFQIFNTASSGTYTTPANCKYIRIRMVGGGGGSSGSGTSLTGTAAGNGGNTTFSTLTASGGSGGGSSSLGVGGNGGGASGSPNIAGIVGGQGGASIGALSDGGTGGGSILGPSTNGQTGANGSPVAGNIYGAGAAGPGGTATIISGTGGGGGGYVEHQITSPAASYSYAVGAGGTAGNAGSGGQAGAAGAVGLIIVNEFYI